MRSRATTADRAGSPISEDGKAKRSKPGHEATEIFDNAGRAEAPVATQKRRRQKRENGAMAEVINFNEASKKVRAQRYKEKVLRQAAERYGEIPANDNRLQLLRQIHDRLYTVLPDLPKGETRLLTSPDINAFAIRGDADVFVHDGLLRQYVAWCQRNGETVSEDAFAFVVTHELGHVRQGTQEVDPLEDESIDKTGNKAESEAKKHTHQERLNNEYDADRFAIQMMARAGYNPREGLKMIKFLQSLHVGVDLAVTHPRSADRLRELVALVESPDTIIQNTDKAPTLLENELLQELAQENPARAGTTLYRKAALEQLDGLMMEAKNISDLLEVVQVTHMHRYLEEINHLRQVESIRTLYAKNIVVDNIEQVLDKLSDVFTDSSFGGRGLSEIVSPHILPTKATRYVMREFDYTQTILEPSPLDRNFVDTAARMSANLEESVKRTKKTIERRLEEISEMLSTGKLNSKDNARYAEYQQKLEYLRDHIIAAVDTTDHSVLTDIVTNAELNAQMNWFHNPDTKQWAEDSSGQDLLKWCASNGSALFSRLAHPVDEQIKQAVGGVVVGDSRYQTYLPAELLAQEDFFTSTGRAAFMEQAIFAYAQDSLDLPSSGNRPKGFLDRVAEISEQFIRELSTKLEDRYAAFAASSALSEAMARAILSDQPGAEYDIERIVEGFSPTEAHLWLTTIQPLWTGYNPSANSLFLAETGLNNLAVARFIPNAYEQFFRFEQACTHIIHSILDRSGDAEATTVTLNNLIEAITFGDEHVSTDALQQIINELNKQSWETATVPELDQRLTPILQILKPEERKMLLDRVFSRGYGQMLNIINVVEYSIEACAQYVQAVLNSEWNQFIALTTPEERLRLLKKIYANHENFSDLKGGAFSYKDLPKNMGAEYIALSIAFNGEDELVVALTDLARNGFAYGKMGEPVFARADIQQRLEALPDEVVLQIAVSCKEADVAHKLYDASRNSFIIYITQRVLEMHGVGGFDPKRRVVGTFDTKRPFAEVFRGIGEYTVSDYSEMALKACVEAYKKSPADIITEGLVQYFKPINRSSLRTGQFFDQIDFDKRTVDAHADKYDSNARPFYEQRSYTPSNKREAVKVYIKESNFIHDRTISPLVRIKKVVDLIPEKTDYRDILFGEIEEDLLSELDLKTEGHRVILAGGVKYTRPIAESLYSFYMEALTSMVDQARMQLWGRRADSLYREYLVSEPLSLSVELDRLQQLFPIASYARDEALLVLGNSMLVETPEQARQVQNLLSELQRQTDNSADLASQSQLERFNLFMGHLSRGEKKDFILWTIGATNEPPKTLRAYGGLHNVSVETVPAFIFAATPQEREQFLLRMFVGSNGLFEPQNSEDQAAVTELIDRSFEKIFPDDAITGVVGQPREVLRTIFTTVMNEYDSYRRGKIFIGMLEALQGNQAGGRGEKIVALMAELGPVFVKVGQVLSETEANPGQYLLPEDIRKAMKKLKQSAKRFHRLAAVFSLEEADEFKEDNVNRIAAVEETLAAASIKQVNSVIRADGRKAVEKILRPSIEKHLQEDVRVLGVIVERLRAFTTVPRGIEEVGATYVQEEADFAREVANTKKIATALEQYKKQAVVRGMPVRTTEIFSFSKRHIQEEKVRGVSLEDLTQLAQAPDYIDSLAKKYNLSEAEQYFFQTLARDTAAVRLQAFDALAFQYFQADAFHSDPHAGNIFITPQAELVMIDNGSIGETQQTDRENLNNFFLGFALQQPDKLRTAVKALTKGLKKQQIEAVVAIAQGTLGDADKMKQILAIVTEKASQLNPSFDKFLKSFATGAYLMSGLDSKDVRTVLGAHTQGESGSWRARIATTAARAAREKPKSVLGRLANRLIQR